MTKNIDKLSKILNRIFAPRVEKYYYYGTKIPENSDVWKKANKVFEKMNEVFKEMGDL